MQTPQNTQYLKRIQIVAKRMVSDAFAGDFKSAFRGPGIEFSEVRPYQHGDDIRHIDWNITARRGAPYVKTYQEERELTIFLLVDASASTLFGSKKNLKADLINELSATLAYVAIQNNDNVGLILFSDQVETYIPPRKGPSHFWKVINSITRCDPKSRQTDLTAALKYLMAVSRKRAIAFLISDFIDANIGPVLALTARKHELVATVISDERERVIPPVGLIALQDAETRETVYVNSSTRQFQTRFQQQRLKKTEQLLSSLQACRVGTLSLTTGKSFLPPLIQFFRSRASKRTY